jgi:hypothetical protein
MKKLVACISMVCITIAGFAQKTINDPNAEKRNVSSFHGISVATVINLIVTAGNTEEVAVSADKIEHRDKIVTEVKEGILKIYYKPALGAINANDKSKNLKAYVSYKVLDELNVASGAKVEINGILNAPSLNLQANSGGSVTGEVNIGSLKVDQHSGSKITLSGKTDKMEIEANSGSKFFGEDLNTANCNATAGTGAKITITVQKELNAKANTGGNIQYKGNGSIRELKTNTGGSVSKI